MRFDDRIIGTFLILASVAIISRTIGFPTLDDGNPGPALFPRVIAGLIAIAGTTLVVLGFSAGSSKDAKLVEFKLDAKGAGNIVLTITLVIAYLLVVPWTGFFVAAGIMSIALMIRFGVSALKAVLSTLAALGFIYVLFVELLVVPLPVWPIF